MQRKPSFPIQIDAAAHFAVRPAHRGFIQLQRQAILDRQAIQMNRSKERGSILFSIGIAASILALYFLALTH